MFKKEKGITLVALVVTIVVLLILAGVSLSLVLGNQGIVTRANEGKTNYTNAAAEESKQLTDAETYMNELLTPGE